VLKAADDTEKAHNTAREEYLLVKSKIEAMEDKYGRAEEASEKKALRARLRTVEKEERVKYSRMMKTENEANNAANTLYFVKWQVMDFLLAFRVKYSDYHATERHTDDEVIAWSIGERISDGRLRRMKDIDSLVRRGIEIAVTEENTRMTEENTHMTEDSKAESVRIERTDVTTHLPIVSLPLSEEMTSVKYEVTSSGPSNKRRLEAEVEDTEAVVKEAVYTPVNQEVMDVQVEDVDKPAVKPAVADEETTTTPVTEVGIESVVDTPPAKKRRRRYT
jgi:hypothetical protein